MNHYINILYIDCHDLGDRLGCYGYNFGITPNLDRLAHEGCLMERYFGAAPQCMPSRFAAYTGMYPETASMFGQNPPQLPVTFMAEHFRQNGYKTSLFVHFPIPVDPEDAGYSDFYRGEHPDAERLKAEIERSRDKPFFIHISYGLVHRPFGNEYDPEIAEKVEVPPIHPDSEITRNDAASFYENVRKLDEYIGKAIKGLEESGKAGETLVVFTTDHGPAFARYKHTLYDTGLKIAALFRLPGTVKRGHRVTGLEGNIGMFPTLCELAGIPELPGRGRSFASALRGEELDSCGYTFAGISRTRRSGQLSEHPARCVRTERYKLIRNFTEDPFYVDTGWVGRFNDNLDLLNDWRYFGNPSPEYELYDLEQDPWETENLAEDPHYRKTRDALAEVMHTHLEETEDAILKGELPNITGEPTKPQWIKIDDRFVLNYCLEEETRERPFEENRKAEVGSGK